MANFKGPPYSLYATLNVSEKASLQAIKKSYQALALQFHPDKNGGDDTYFKEIQSAYDVLSDATKKKEYDDYCRQEIARQAQSEYIRREKEKQSPIYKTKSPSTIREKLSEWLKAHLHKQFGDVWTDSIGQRLDEDIDASVKMTSDAFSSHPFKNVERMLRQMERLCDYESPSFSGCEKLLEEFKKCYPDTDISFWQDKLKKIRPPKKNPTKGKSSSKDITKQEVSEAIQNLERHILSAWRKAFEQQLLEWMLAQIEAEKQTIYAKYFGLLNNLRHLKNTLAFLPHFGWDLGIGELTASDIQILLQWSKVFKNNSKLQELCALLGKMNREATKREKIKIQEVQSYENIVPDVNSREEICGITFNNHIEDALPQELGLLSDEDIELLFDLKFVENRLMTFEKAGYTSETKTKVIEKEKSVEKKDKKGPVIVCIDTSGSMSGQPESIAKALTLCLASMAHKQDRSCYMINFSTGIETFDFSKDKGLGELLKFLQMGFNGGTDVFPALEEGLKMMAEKDYKKADLLVVSDFEFSYENSDLLKKIETQRQKGNHFFGLTIMEDYGWRNERIRQSRLFDEMWECSPSSYDVRRLYSHIEKMAGNPI